MKQIQQHPFAHFIRTLGRGKKGSRSLTFAEAQEAMGMILENTVEPEQLGAFLMLLRVKEESPEEIAGFVSSVREHLPAITRTIKVDLDWSSYAGKRKQHPWFILAILALSQSGKRILIHGSDGHTENRIYTRAMFQALELPVASDWETVDAQLQAHALSYLHLEHIHPRLQTLITLKPLLGLRSPINTLVRLINPCRAPYSISSIFHPAYARIQTEASQLLEQPHFAVFKGEGGEIECRPEARLSIDRLVNGHISDSQWPRLQQERAADQGPLTLDSSASSLRAMWRGEQDDAYAFDTVLQTLTVCISLFEPELSLEQCTEQAHAIWDARDLQRL